MKQLILLFLIPFCLYATYIPTEHEMDKCRNVTFFLTTRKSGSNVISGSLSIITRKPISWVKWGKEVLKPTSKLRDDNSYNRAKVPLITLKPLLYRTHFDYDLIMQAPSKLNRLIFVTRNPKELIYRDFFIEFPEETDPDPAYIQTFLARYLPSFKVYDSWVPSNKKIVYYEDFIERGDEILLSLLQFMGEKPTFLKDYLENKEKYLSRLLESYSIQHAHTLSGASSRGKPKAIYYTKDANPEVLKFIDEYLQRMEPVIWEKYLKRFQSI